MPAAALTRFSPPDLPDDQWNEKWIMTISTQSSCPAQHELSEGTKNLAESSAADHVNTTSLERRFDRPVELSCGQLMERRWVTDHVKRVRLRTENGERVMTDFRSANVTHPILSVSGMLVTR